MPKHTVLRKRRGGAIDCNPDTTPKELCKEVEKYQKSTDELIEKLNKRLAGIVQENYILAQQLNALLDILEDRKVLTKLELKNLNFVRKLIGSLQL